MEDQTEAEHYDPFMAAKGVLVVIVNGEIALENGKSTGVCAGKILLKQR